MQRIGNYRIDGELGRDATGVVYEARHLVLPRRAIVKVMEEVQPRPLAIQLLREACILEALEHPGTVRVYESGLLPDRRPWFACERIDGATVADLLSTPLALEPDQSVLLLRDIAEVLDHAHRRGVIHCGLRPDRIVITGRSRGFPLCIVDWSDARVHDTTAPLPEVTVRDYAAPELLAGERSLDDRVDVFSLGVIAYRALTGEMPFETITADGEAQHLPTAVRAAEVPPELTGLVDSMLAWERFDRPSSAEVHAELAQLAIELEPPAPHASGSLRIRRPRWTPAFPVGEGDVELGTLDHADTSDPGEKSS